MDEPPVQHARRRWSSDWRCIISCSQHHPDREQKLLAALLSLGKIVEQPSVLGTGIGALSCGFQLPLSFCCVSLRTFCAFCIPSPSTSQPSNRGYDSRKTEVLQWYMYFVFQGSGLCIHSVIPSHLENKQGSLPDSGQSWYCMIISDRREVKILMNYRHLCWLPSWIFAGKYRNAQYE